MKKSSNPHLNKWIDEMVALVQPDQVIWIDGSEEQRQDLYNQACDSGEMIRLNQE